MGKTLLMIIFAAAVLFLAGCGPPSPEVEIFHSPVVATTAENVTFTTTVLEDGNNPVDVEILVNAARVHTCDDLSEGDTCTYVGGPFADYEGTTVSYLANATNGDRTDSRGYYYFAITDADYNWGLNYMPARMAGDSVDHFDLIFHRAADYASVDDFVDDVEDKLYDVYAEQDIIERPDNYDDLNFFIYSKEAQDTADCGTVHADTDVDITFRNHDAILHTADLTDCNSPGKGSFTAEGYSTKAFLHESGHGLFGLADEYDAAPGCGTSYRVPAVEPNIWALEANCRTEQTDKGRDPDECQQFTTCRGGRWGIHEIADNTVMVWGDVGDPWGIEAAERVNWWFDQPMP
jgi:hypothetical protein